MQRPTSTDLDKAKLALELLNSISNERVSKRPALYNARKYAKYLVDILAEIEDCVG